MDIAGQIAKELSIRTGQAEAVIKLIDEGNTIPFIARYRKEAHGSLDDEQIRNISERLIYLRNLEEKKEQVLAGIEEQGKLTEELKKQIEEAMTQVVVEDLYRPYRPKRRTRASIAREKGLGGLADIIMAQETAESIEELAVPYISVENEVNSAKEAAAGAKDIIAEIISDNAEYRMYIRKVTFEEGRIISEAKDSSIQSVYEMYYNFSEQADKIAGHRILALNRGEKEKFLVVKLEAPEERILLYLAKKIITSSNESITAVLKDTIEDSYKRLIAPAIEREIRNELTEKAEDGAIKVFGKNLAQLLMQPPVAGRNVLGWDPAFRTGCKLAVVDSTGKVLDTTVVYPTAPQNKVEETKKVVKELVGKYNISLISVGNGTASRESEQIIADMLKEIKEPVQYVIVNEAGASVYSASKLATEEFPEFDVGQRSAASIARRLQDPLAELVKIDPKSVGVGQYQHDMNQKKLEEALAGVVEDCVNKVGVDLNTASAPLLGYISGISKAVAKNIVTYREENGKFTDRKQLLKVAKLGPKAFEQCAGFMRIQGGSNMLDATSVHPESYGAAEKLLKKLGITDEDLKKIQADAAKSLETDKTAIKKDKGRGNKKGFVIKNTNTAFGAAFAKAFGNDKIPVADTEKRENNKNRGGGLAGRIKDKKKMAAELGIGEITLDDILKELEKPARDPRDEMPLPILRTDVLEIKDLKEGMVLKGTVRNVIDFGAFVDIGVHQDGLIHISQLSNNRFVKHPLDVVSVGDIVDVKVLSVDINKQRIQLTMKI
ncbi:MAG: Tex family protein [Lachnospiraceae bacterium]|nr:Tex family protein [Lachnospiraceae bacterium]